MRAKPALRGGAGRARRALARPCVRPGGLLL